ncbi:MAG: DNA alkylation repair protein, partial [Nitrospira sp.]|nr:DNA alkylation repair protein [Nitrospira sp.]
MKIHQSITELQRRLDAASSEQKKIWWEKYLRGAAAFRGVGIPHIRDILVVWRHDTGVADLPVDEQLDIAMALFEVPITEDKLAGILLLQEYLRMCFDWKDLLPKYASLFERNLI